MTIQTPASPNPSPQETMAQRVRRIAQERLGLGPPRPSTPSTSAPSAPDPQLGPPVPEQKQQFLKPSPFTFKPWQPAEGDEAVQKEFSNFVEMWGTTESGPLGNVPDLFAFAPNPLQGPVPSGMPQLGQQPDILDAYGNIFFAVKQLEALAEQQESYDPEGVRQLRESIPEWVRSKVPTMQPMPALLGAMNHIAEKYPDNYTAFLASDAGRAELWDLAASSMLAPGPQQGLNVGERLLAGAATIPMVPDQYNPGVIASDFLDEELPDFVGKDIFLNSVEIMGDPIMLATLPILPGAGIAAKVGFGMAVAGGMAFGEEAAEEVGAPRWVGSLVGGFGGPAVVGAGKGFTRAAWQQRLRNARENPKLGEPATEVMAKANAVYTDMSQVRMAFGNQPIYYRGISSVQEGQAVAKGAMLTSSADEAQMAAAAAVKQYGGEPLIQTIDSAKGGVTALKEDAIKSALGVREKVVRGRVDDADIIRVLTPDELPSISGGATGVSLATSDDIVNALFLRPEADDAARKVARTLGTRIPGFKRLVQTVNRYAVADDPAVQSAASWVGMKQIQDAERFMMIAPFRGTKKMFAENHIGQIWLPNKAGQQSNFMSRFQKNGRWYAMGDVFEDVMLGGTKFSKSLTAEQVDYILRMQKAMGDVTKATEQTLGLKITKRFAHWPRVAIDPFEKLFHVSAGNVRKGGKPTGLYARRIEEQQRAIEQYGLKYRPGVVENMEQQINSMQRLQRDAILKERLIRDKVITVRKPSKAVEIGEKPAKFLGAGLDLSKKGPKSDLMVMSSRNFHEVMNIIGPGTKTPWVTLPEKANAIMRALLTGTMDTGHGTIQLMTLFALDPARWAEAVGRGMFNMIVEPKQYYRFMGRMRGAQMYSAYGGSLSAESEFLEGISMMAIPERIRPFTGAPVDVATFPIRSFVNRLQVGFETTLAYGRVLAFEAMADAAAKPGMLLRVMGAKPLKGKALHDEMFRLTRFTDSLLGQPKLQGVLGETQRQAESAFLWFATRYTRSFMGTMSYVVGKGYTPAQARAIMTKMMFAGATIMSGLIAAKGKAQGLSPEEVQEQIITALNPASGKKFMSIEAGGSWYGLGGVYRSGFAAVASLGDKRNWEFETWNDALFGNAFVRMWRSRTTPLTGDFMDFIEGEDFMGRGVERQVFDHPKETFDYLLDSHAPIAIDAYLQGHGSWQNRLPATTAEFFGMRTSPETAWEAMEPLLDRVTGDLFNGKSFADLEHNVAAKDIIQNHPDVQDLAAGEIRPLRQTEEEKKWDAYSLARNTIRWNIGVEKSDLEQIFMAGNMDGKAYQQSYREINTKQFLQLTQMRESMGIDFSEKDPPPGTVDHILGQYYELDLDDYEDSVTGIPDWEAWFADRGAILEQVPDEYVKLVENYLNRSETPLRADFRYGFEDVIEPSGYFQVREYVTELIGLDASGLEDNLRRELLDRDMRASPADVGRFIDKFLDQQLEARYGEDTDFSLTNLRKRVRESNPDVDLQLYRQGFVTTVRTQEAVDLAKRMMEEFLDLGYFIPRLAQDSPDRD